jgi:integrase
VISKGSRLREPIPASPEAFGLLAVYLDTVGLPTPEQPVWRTLDDQARPVSYWTIRRALQRANAKLGTNWTLHDLRHTTAVRMSRSGALTLPEIQVIMRHRDLAVTGAYLNPRLEDMVAALAAHYATPPNSGGERESESALPFKFRAAGVFSRA